MQKLTLDNFIIANADFETSQYNILSTLQEYKNELKQFKLYPVYQYLSTLVEELENVLVRKACIKECSPVRLIKFELPENEEVIDTENFIKTEMGKIWKLIEWGYDTISPIFEEACILHDFIERNINLMAIEDSDDYEKSGCLLVPNNKMAELNFYKFSNSNTPYLSKNQKTVEANLIESINFNEIYDNNISNIGDKLINGYPELTSSPVYAIKTGLDLPFNESILPVAKKILADELSA
ncbi:MAG: hypothetical protein HND52_17170 [Ignavibacteriae bacterium]|nr:hypothetical protein [Ignavibacteriota bacterium]NOG99693.1 hypothetical protein [Ignavibacteriota bacterium]